MKLFKYSAITPGGQRIDGEREADSKEDIVKYLQSQNLTVLTISDTLGFDLKTLINTDIGGLPLNDRVILLKQLSTMIGASIPIIQAIDILVQQTEKDSIKAKLQNIYKSIESGNSLSDALKKEPGILSNVHINLIEAGEKSANLNEMLTQIADDLEKSKNLRGKIRGALIYPVIIFITIFVVMAIMITTMIPQVKDLYMSLGQTELPAITEILVKIGDLLANPVGLLALVFMVVVAFVLYKYAYSLESGKLAIDRFKLRIPIFGKLIQKSEVAQFCRLSAMLSKSGIQILEVIQIVADTSDNNVFKKILLSAKEDVLKGNGLSLSIAKYNINEAFPIILLRIMATGEESGKLDRVMDDMSEYYQNEVEQMAGNLTKLMEPLIMLIAGGLVAFLAIAVYLPIFQVSQFVA